MGDQTATESTAQTIEEIKFELREEMRLEMRAELHRMQAATPGIPSGAQVATSAATSESSRRQMLRRGGLAVGAGLAAATVISRPVAAAGVDPVEKDVINLTTSTTGVQSSGTDIDAVLGIATAASGANWGVRGDSDSDEGVGVGGQALSTTGETSGVLGITQSPDGVGVLGLAEATNGIAPGVYGFSASPDGVGVQGEVNTSDLRPGFPIGGMVGTDDGQFGRGVVGDTRGAEATGVLGSCNAPAAHGVWGNAKAGTGVKATSADGVGGSFAGTTAALLLTPTGSAPTTLSNTHAAGEIYLDTSNDLWLCTASGTPGTWAQLNGAAGPTLRPVAPFRVYDSRFGLRPLAQGASRVVSIKDSIDPVTGAVIGTDAVPAGATGIAFNLTIVNTKLGGFIALAPGDATKYSAASINWSATGQTVGNGGVGKLDSNRQVKIFADGAPGCAADFIIDVTGIFS
jgi:hypothetical protein